MNFLIFMSDFAKFLSVNGLKRAEIATYLGTSGAFVSQIASGSRPLPAKKLAKIKANAYGWDTSMLVTTTTGMSQGVEIVPKVQIATASQRQKAVDALSILRQDSGYTKRLMEEIEELKKSIEALREETALLREENAVLKFQLKDSK